MTDTISREIRLKRRPVGMPLEDDFELVKVKLPEIQQGQLRVRNIYMSVDPYMRGRMVDRESYVPPFQVGQPLEGGCIGQVIESKTDKFKNGEFVLGMLGWRDYYISDGVDLTRVTPGPAPLTSYLGVMGMPGLTAYAGLLEVGRPKEGETVFVSAAAGAVGSIVCQLAKIRGCRVVGSTGSDHKVAWLLEEAGIDAAFNYKKIDRLTAELRRHCPDGIDLHFENVGGDHLQAALSHMKVHGRIILCGLISQYNAAEPAAGPSNLFNVIVKRLTIQGILVRDHFDKLPQFNRDMGRWLAEGRINWKETVVEGLENAPRAFIGLFRGENLGKMIVKIGPDPML